MTGDFPHLCWIIFSDHHPNVIPRVGSKVGRKEAR